MSCTCIEVYTWLCTSSASSGSRHNTVPESKTKSTILFYCTLVLTHLYRDSLGLIQGRAPSPGGPGPKPPRDLAHRPLGPPLSPVDFLQAELRLKPINPGLKTLGYHNPQSADLGERWMVSEGGALQFHERRGSRLCSSP